MSYLTFLMSYGIYLILFNEQFNFLMNYLILINDWTVTRKWFQIYSIIILPPPPL